MLKLRGDYLLPGNFLIEGCLLRIADSLEKIAVNIDVEKLLHRIAGLKGTITRMKKQTKKG